MSTNDDKRLARMEQLVSTAERKALRFDELRELAQLYRTTSAQLSMQRTRGKDPDWVRYLNALCLRAYAHVYAAPARKRQSRAFFLRELPRTLGRTVPLQLLAASLLALAALAGAQVVLANESALPALVPAGMYPPDELERLWSSEPARKAFLAPRDEPFAVDTLFASSLFANNTRVSALGLATGILAAVPTVLLLVYNGLTLGAFSAIFLRGPERLDFLAWIVPHAIPELLAIVLCCAGGLQLGLAVLAPGRGGRAAAVRSAGLDALRLLAASIPLLVLAALIESFVRQSLLGATGRFAVAAAAALSLLAYVALCRVLARRLAPVDVSFLARAARSDSITPAPPRAAAGSDRAAAR